VIWQRDIVTPHSVYQSKRVVLLSLTLSGTFTNCLGCWNITWEVAASMVMRKWSWVFVMVVNARAQFLLQQNFWRCKCIVVFSDSV